MTKPKKTASQLAHEHWDWLESVLATQRLIERQLFIDAFVHGYKHSERDKGSKNG